MKEHRTGKAINTMICANKLDNVQKQAVHDTEGAVLIYSPAGSGKTAVISARVAHLIDGGVSPQSILAITYTNKAAEELRSRIAQYTGLDVSDMWIGTFHSICLRILRILGRRGVFGTSLSIYDESDATATLKGIMNELGLNLKEHPLRDMLAEISRCKRSMETIETYSRRLDPMRCRILNDVMECYKEELRRQSALDFDDVILETIRMLNESPQCMP